MEFSNNGYHLAAAYRPSGMVRIWDLRKQKTIQTLNAHQELLPSVSTVRYDPSAKYLALAGTDRGVVSIVTVKEWTQTTQVVVDDAKGIHDMVWGPSNTIVTCSDKDRAIRFHGIAPQDE